MSKHLDLFDTTRRTDTPLRDKPAPQSVVRTYAYTDDERFQRELSAAVRATGSGCTGVTIIDVHSHYQNGSCDDELPYAQGGPA